MIRGFVSAIRGEWALVDEVDAYSMPNSVYLGLAAHSNNNYTRAVSAFSDVRYQLEMQGNV